MSLSVSEFLQLRSHQPVLDVRSPGEFNQGHIPGAYNLPLLNNEERIIVGTAYKQKGRREAIHEGFRLVGPRLFDIITEAEAVSQGQEVLVHCWRGGMRSNNFCQFVKMAGMSSRSLTGGYKAYRQAALQSFQKPLPIILLTGYTGSGKSDVLRALARRGEQILDLEALAKHKGSAFGGLMMPPQPTTEQFQNELFEAIMKVDPSRRVWVEDESLAIGKIFLPEPFFQMMRERPLVRMEVDKAVRVRRLVREYGDADHNAFLEIMKRIVKKLGGQHFKAASENLSKGDMEGTIDILLTYYDKAYHESIIRRKDSVRATIGWDGADADDYAKKLIDVSL